MSVSAVADPAAPELYAPARFREKWKANPLQQEKAMKKVLVSILSLAIILSLSQLAAGQTGANSQNNPLLQAAAQGNTAVVQQLLDKGANIESKDKNGYTALILAAVFNNTEVVKLLLARGANIEAKNNDGNTALIWAAFKDKLEVVKLLLANGANINAKNNDGDTALTMATIKSATDVVNLLQEKGAH
jgi:ankyrin repeat protein